MSGVLFATIVFVATLPATEKPAVDARIPDGHYVARKFLLAVYVKVAGDTAFADILDVDKMPRRLYTDTLYYDRQSQRWQGKTTVLYQKKRKLVLRTSPQTPVHSFDDAITIKPHKGYTDRRLEHDKNVATWRTFHEPYNRKFMDQAGADNTLDMQVLATAEKGLNFDQPHAAFLKAFEEFKATLQRLRAEAGLPTLNLEEIRDRR